MSAPVKPTAAAVAAAIATLLALIAWAFGGASTPSPTPAPTASASVTTSASASATSTPTPTGKPVAPASFKVASLAMYGCSEYRWVTPKGWKSCTDRVPDQLAYINTHGVEIVALQEMEQAPFNLLYAYTHKAGSVWGINPTKPVFTFALSTAVMWRTDRWQLIEQHTLKLVKDTWADAKGKPVYAYSNNPVVLLQNRASGQKVWVIAIQNIAHSGAWKTSWLADQILDTTAEAAEFRKLRETAPVLLMGDTNDTTSRTLCAIQKGVPAAHSIWPGGCASKAWEPMDKIIGSVKVTFTGAKEDWSTQANHLTDHGVPTAVVTLR